jgi:hypothetical protein
VAEIFLEGGQHRSGKRTHDSAAVQAQDSALQGWGFIPLAIVLVQIRIPPAIPPAKSGRGPAGRGESP